MEHVATHLRVAEAIRSAISDGDLAPGQRLIEADLAVSFGISRGAVREVLLGLSHEGVLERIANRGARVRIVSIEEAIQVTEVRMVIEELCARRAAELISDDEIVELRQLGEGLKQAVADLKPDDFGTLNHQLHERLIQISAQSVAADVISRLQARSVRYQFKLSHRSGRPKQSLPHFLAIIEAVCARDSEAAASAVRVHLQSVIDLLRNEEQTRPSFV